MNFEIVNEELKIASCRIADLTMDQVQHFLGLWEKGAKIGELTLFYEYESGYVVLNRDNGNYPLYLDITEAYLSVSEEGRRTLQEEGPDSLKETLQVLEGAINQRMVGHELFIVGRNGISDSYYPVLKEILRRSDSASSTMMMSFIYGVICGKRRERTRRKRRAAV